MFIRRDKILSLIPFILAIIVLAATFLLVTQLSQFKKTYMDDEERELIIESRQIVWAITPMLELNNISLLKEYCMDFSADKIMISVMNSEDNVIAASKDVDEEHDKEITKQEIFKLLSNQDSSVVRHRHDKKKHILYHFTKIDIGNDYYILKVSVSSKNISEILDDAELEILMTVLAGLALVFLINYYVVNHVKKPFNKLENSAIKIANGDLSADIFVPEDGVLWELSKAIDVMAKKLKSQISDLQRLENYRSEFIANVSHEIKTPLTSILSSVELLSESHKDLSDNDKRCFEILVQQSQRLNSLIQDILSLASLEKLQTLGNKDTSIVNINGYIVDALNSCVEIARMKNIELKNLGLEDAMIETPDPQLVSQAVINLISNAVKYSRSPVIEVFSDISGDELQIHVKDYGVGIDESHQKRIFERFYCVDKTRSRELAGTGLGLAIVKNIALLHNGSVRLESGTNGCEFIINLKISRRIG